VALGVSTLPTVTAPDFVRHLFGRGRVLNRQGNVAISELVVLPPGGAPSCADERAALLFHGLPQAIEKVALVCSPWGSVSMPSLALPILKRCAEQAGFKAELQYLNILFARQIGLATYEAVAEKGFLSAEWFFSPALFGGEMGNSWLDLQATAHAESLLEGLRTITGTPDEEFCERIASVEVPKFLDTCLESIDWQQYQVVGFTTTFAQSLASLALAKRLKEAYPRLHIVFGGANVDSEMGVEFMRAFPWIDYVVHGEAEESFPALLQALRQGASAPAPAGVSFRRNSELVQGDLSARPLTDLNISPKPDYSDYMQALKRAQLRIKPRLLFESSRGCWWGAKHHCTFCGLNAGTMTYRKKDPAQVYDELLELARENKCLTFAAVDNILANDYFAQLLPRLAETDIDLNLFYEVKGNLSREQVRLLSRARVAEIQPGIENLSSRVLQLMNKGITAIQNVQLLKWCAEFDVVPAWNVLFGFPGETAEDYHEQADVCALIAHLCPPHHVGPLMFERFSPYFYDAAKYGLTLRPKTEYSFIFPESRCRLDKLAYFFDGESPMLPDPEPYTRELLDVCARWKQYWKTREVFCYYDRGEDYVVIHDNRPLHGKKKPAYRQLTLTGLSAEVFLYCDEYRTVKKVRETVASTHDEAEATRTEQVLDHLVNAGVMFREGERYLSLAIRRKPDRQMRS